MIKTVIREYWYLSRSGLLRNSYFIMAITACFMLLFGRYIGVELEILLFILTPIIFMLDFDANKYVISYSLPICMKYRLDIIYYLTVIHSFLAVLALNIGLGLSGLSRPFTVNCTVFLVNIIGSNLYYYLFCSQEFKKDVLDEDKKQLGYQCIIGAMIGIVIATRVRWGLNSPAYILIERMSRGYRIGLVSILAIVTILWTKVSMKRLKVVVRDGR